MPNDLLLNIDKVHTTAMGAERIRRNLSLADTEDVVLWCKRQIENPDAITRAGKNWYVRGEGFVITVNAGSYTIITAHREKPKKGSDMRDVGIIRKLDDIPELKDKLIGVFDTKTHRNVSSYGLLLADHILQITGTPMDDTLAACFDVNRRWQDGAASFQEARDVAGLILDRAREEKDPVREKALRVAAQVAAIPHVKRHALIASDYGIKVINLMRPGDLDAVRTERESQIRMMESV
jgi:hypothetical protein